MKKVETVVIRERVETVIDAVEEATGHVGVTVTEAIGHKGAQGHGGAKTVIEQILAADASASPVPQALRACPSRGRNRRP